MNKEIYEIDYIKEFISEVALPVWRKQRKILPNRPVSYSITKIKEGIKRSCVIELNFSDSLIKTGFIEPLEFRVTKKFFKTKDYDFSKEWQEFQARKESVQSL